jgi:hypothetical protein
MANHSATWSITLHTECPECGEYLDISACKMISGPMLVLALVNMTLRQLQASRSSVLSVNTNSKSISITED